MSSGYMEKAGAGEWFAYGGYEFYETGRQRYTRNGCIFAAGIVHGHPVDTHYLWIEKDDQDPQITLLRPDEVAAIAWLCSGSLWTKLMGDLHATNEADGQG